MNLIITEKPSVARAFAEALGVNKKEEGYLEGNGWTITWAFGHLVEMDDPESYNEKYKEWNLEDLPIIPFEYKYHVIPESKKQFKIIKELYNSGRFDTLYLAPDPAREGLYIQSLILKEAGHAPMDIKVVWISSQTESEIQRGIKEAKPYLSYCDLESAGYLRSEYDWLIGMNCSRAESVKYARIISSCSTDGKYHALHVGRVMSTVLGMVVSREREIRGHQSVPFYNAMCSLKEAEGKWYAPEPCEYALFEDSRENLKNKSDAEAIIKNSPINNFTLKSSSITEKKEQPPLLFNLAELQAECSKKFKMSPDKTLQTAQSLYEKKLTTYPRTDSRYLSTAIAKEINMNLFGLKEFNLEVIGQILTGPWKDIAKSRYTNDAKVSDHYAIIPTGETAAYNSLSDMEKAVYQTILLRFVSIFMPPKVVSVAKASLCSNNNEYRFSAEQVKSLGFRELYDDEIKKNPAYEELSNIKDGFTVTKTYVKEGKTNPPKRYTTGSLILAMENAGKLIEDPELRGEIKGTGIGTSATRADIIEKLTSSKVACLTVERKTQVITPTGLGEAMYDLLLLTLPAYLNPSITASWEKGLREVAEGVVSEDRYRQMMVDDVKKRITEIKQKDIAEELRKRIAPFITHETTVVETSITCPVCHKGHLVHFPGRGYGCSEHKKDDDSSCSFFIGKVFDKDLDEATVRELCENGKTDGEIALSYKDKATGQKKSFKSILLLKEVPHYKTGVPTLSVTLPEREKTPTEETEYKCPLCGKSLVKTPSRLRCSCGFSMPHTLSKKVFDDELIKRMLNGIAENGETEEITGLISKSGNSYSTKLVLDKKTKELTFPKRPKKN